MKPQQSVYRTILRMFMVLCLLAGVLAGCTDMRIRSRSLESITAGGGQKPRLSPADMRIQTQALANRFAGIIEGSADEIIAAADTAEVRREALLWKINGIPLCYNTIFQSDPFIAFIDTWAMAEQMKNYFDTGPGKDALGDLHTIAVEASEQMMSGMEAIAIKASPDGNIDEGLGRVNEWAAANPIASPLFIRNSVSPEMASNISNASLGTIELVGELAIGFADLSAEMTAYANYLPKQARWQTELFMEDLSASQNMGGALKNFSQITKAADRMAALAAESSDLIERERNALAAILQGEREAVLKDIDRQRLDSIRALRQERQVVMAAVTAERLAISELVRTERAQTMVDLDHMRSVSIDKFEATSERLLQEALERSKEYIDHFFFRSAQLSAVILGVLLVAGYVLVILIKRKP